MELGNLGKVGVLAAVVGLALAGCGGQRAADDSRTLTLAVVADVTSWDPAQAHVGHQLQPYQPVYDTLIQREPDGTLSPMLATAWAYNDDRTELTLDLRTGVTFSDGTTFDAAAAKANHSARISPISIAGLSELYGSWNTTCRSRLSLRRRARPACEMSSPAKVIRPAVTGARPSSARPRVVSERADRLRRPSCRVGFGPGHEPARSLSCSQSSTRRWRGVGRDRLLS
jgi:hypothetical protein